MDARELEITLEATLAMSRPTPRDLRDAIVDYYVVAARPFLEQGLAYTHPDADEGVIRRLLLLRLTTLWHGRASSWDDPKMADLIVFRARIEQYACVRSSPRFLRVQQLLDDLVLAVTIGERVHDLARRIPRRRLRLISGGGEVSAPRGRLAVVRPEAQLSVPSASGEAPT